MPATYPNQKIVTIHKEPLNGNYLGINRDVLFEACKRLTPYEFELYVYLACNRDNYELRLSQSAVNSAIGMPRSTYYDQVHNLINKGYLVENQGNRYDFYERPRGETKERVSRDAVETPVNSGGFDFTALSGKSLSEDREIYNRKDNYTDIINNYNPYTNNNNDGQFKF